MSFGLHGSLLTRNATTAVGELLYRKHWRGGGGGRLEPCCGPGPARPRADAPGDCVPPPVTCSLFGAAKARATVRAKLRSACLCGRGRRCAFQAHIFVLDADVHLLNVGLRVAWQGRLTVDRAKRRAVNRVVVPRERQHLDRTADALSALAVSRRRLRRFHTAGRENEERERGTPPPASFSELP
jgi:hypothetical protein